MSLPLPFPPGVGKWGAGGAVFQHPRALLPRAAPRAAAEPGPGPPRPQKALVVPTVDGAFVGVLGDGVLAPGAGLSSQGCHYSFWLRDRHGLLPLELSAVGE